MSNAKDGAFGPLDGSPACASVCIAAALATQAARSSDFSHGRQEVGRLGVLERDVRNTRPSIRVVGYNPAVIGSNWSAVRLPVKS